MNDLDGVTGGHRARRVLGPRDDDAVDLDRDRPLRQRQVLEELAHRHAVRNLLLLAVQRDDHGAGS